MIDMGNNLMETPLIDAANAKIQDPNFDCSNLRDPRWALSEQTYNLAPPEPDTVDWSNYVAPLNTGSGNDFDGAGPRPAPTPTNISPSNKVYNSESSSGNSQNSDDCPLDYSGLYPTTGCATYVNCNAGSVVGVAQPCVPGTLFDVTIQVCNWATQVLDCGAP